MNFKRRLAPRIWWLVLLLLLVASIWATSWWLLVDVEERGTFGDMFGAVNALFSGLAFAAIIFTVWMQHVELSLQREELKLTRAELRGQREQLEAQNTTLVMQRFENTFFELIKVHGQIVESIDLKSTSGNITKGRDCLRVFYDRLRSRFDRSLKDQNVEQALARARIAYEEFFDSYEYELGHYFRHLYHILKFVKQSDIPDKRRYTNFVRAQLSSFELALLFYDGMSLAGEEKFKSLIEEFAILKHLPRKLLFSSQHAAFYRESAYGDRAKKIS